eukprot:SAG31_NODE_30_length_32545_cov_9.378999_31_plen_161_part_00
MRRANPSLVQLMLPGAFALLLLVAHVVAAGSSGGGGGVLVSVYNGTGTFVGQRPTHAFVSPTADVTFWAPAGSSGAAAAVGLGCHPFSAQVDGTVIFPSAGNYSFRTAWPSGYPSGLRGGVRAVTFSFLCQLLEKYGTFIARCNALIEKVSSFRVAPAPV